MLTGLLHRVVAQPWVYDLVQTAVGAKTVRRRVAEQVAPLRSGASLVLDIGGGTGAVGELWDRRTRYVCLDIDPLKLAGFLNRNPRGTGLRTALQGDATRLPVADRTVDVVLCNSVTHHLTDDLFERMVAEASRVLKPSGKLVLTDATWEPRRRVGRLIWKYDRGSFPRTVAHLRRVIDAHFVVRRWDLFAVWHEYVLCVAEPRQPTSDL